MARDERVPENSYRSVPIPNHTATCEPSTHCGAPVDHDPHPMSSGRTCTGMGCPVTAVGLAESADRIRANRQAATDLGAADTLALDRIAACLKSPVSVPIKLSTIRGIIKATGR